MSRIEIRGIIVPSDFDGGWYQGLSDKGIITPESKFRRELAAASAGEPLSVYINTPGGSVFAGNEMVNSVMAWKAQHKQPVHVTIGAMAASMGSAFAIQVADKISVHRNSMMMFHGAWGVQIGGSEAMKDYGDVLAKINAMTQKVLLARYELNPEHVAEWFREGREGWLTADEMRKAKIANEVIGADDGAMDLDGADIAAFDAHGLKIAALAQGLSDLKKKAVKDDDGNNATQGGAGGAVADGAKQENEHGTAEGSGGSQSGATDGASAVAATGQGESVPAQQPVNGGEGGSGATDALNAERLAGREEGRQEVIAECAAKVNEARLQVESAEALARQLQSDRDKARAELEKARAQHEKSLGEMTEQLKAATKRLEDHLNGGLVFSATPRTWQEALASCGGDYVKAARQYPELKQAYNEAKKSR